MSITPRELLAHFGPRTPARTRRLPVRLPVRLTDVPVGRPGWTQRELCPRCQCAPVFAAKLCVQCHEQADAVRVAKAAVEQASQLVTS